MKSLEFKVQSGEKGVGSSELGVRRLKNAQRSTLNAQRFLLFLLLLTLNSQLSTLNSLFALTVTELQEKMAESDARLQSIQFNYLQEMRSALSPEVKQSSGTAYFKKPKLLRIEQKLPESQLIVSSGKTVFVYTPRFQQVLKDSWKRWSEKNILFPGLSAFSDSFWKLKQDYRWEIIEKSEINGEKTVSIRLDQAGAQQEHQLKLWISESDFLPRKTELVSGTLTLTTTFVALQFNPELNPELFNFKRPQNSEVIQMP